MPGIVKYAGKVQGADLVQGLIGQAAWTVAFVVAARTEMFYGVRRYSAFGG